MNCPVCNGTTGVVDSRPDEESVHRRRRCFDCGYRFGTIELDADQWDKKQQKPKEPPVMLHFSVEYDPTTGAARLLSKKEART